MVCFLAVSFLYWARLERGDGAERERSLNPFVSHGFTNRKSVITANGYIKRLRFLNIF
jgi:hypothetical protein